MVKSSGVKRESEGAIVPRTVTKQNVTTGKGPHFGHALQGGKREGMGGEPPNYPKDKVQQLQSKLWAAAKQSPSRRFHALYDRISRSDVLEMAWSRVRANRGAAGVDSQTIAAIEAYGVDRLLAEIKASLEEGSYHPQPSLRVNIPKSGGGTRPLGIPTVKDRIVQQATKLVIEPIFDADFSASSYGYRPMKSATDALEEIRKAFPKGYTFAVELDIADFFGSIDHEMLMKLVQQRISDRRVLKLVRKWLKAGVMESGRYSQTVTGTPQGGVISPLLANIYLNLLDQIWEQEGKGILVRYADDLVALCRTPEEAEQAEEMLKFCLAVLGLEANSAKTRRVDLREGREGFDFLGCHFHARVSGKLLEQGVRKYYLHRWPSTESMKRIRSKVRNLTGHNRAGVKDIRVLIAQLNPVLRGWGNYFRTGNASIKFTQIDKYVAKRLRNLLSQRYGGRPKPKQYRLWTLDWFRDQGLHRLFGTIRYPGVRNYA